MGLRKPDAVTDRKLSRATHSSMILKMFSNKKVITCDDDDNYDSDN